MSSNTFIDTKSQLLLVILQYANFDLFRFDFTPQLKRLME